MTAKSPNLKRKTPCASTKAGLQSPSVTSIYCSCCGEWKMRNGKPVRYIERVVSR